MVKTYQSLCFHHCSLLETETSCPMCSEKVQAGELVAITDLKQFLYPEGEEWITNFKFAYSHSNLIKLSSYITLMS